MTVRELIAHLLSMPLDAEVFVMTGPDCDIPDCPEPRYDNGEGLNKTGVYL